MMRIEKLDEIVSTIRSWNKDNPRLVVAIDGYSGSGKTSILKKIEQKISVTALSLDDFVYEFPRRKACVDESGCSEIEFPECWYRFEEVFALISAFRGGTNSANIARYDFEKNVILESEVLEFHSGILIVEGAFIIERLKRRRLVDRTIVVVSDLADADSRREQRERIRWGERYQTDSHPESYVRLFKRAYQYYLERGSALARADLLVLN